MSVFVLTDAYISIAGTNLSSHITQVTLHTAYDIVETTGFGNTSKTRIAGLADNNATFDFNQDFAAATAGVEAVIGPLLGTAATFEIRPTSSAASTTNPKYTGSVLISEWSPLDGKIGDLATVSVSWPISGNVTKALS